MGTQLSPRFLAYQLTGVPVTVAVKEEGWTTDECDRLVLKFGPCNVLRHTTDTRRIYFRGDVSATRIAQAADVNAGLFKLSLIRGKMPYIN